MWVVDKGRKIVTEEGRDAIISVVIDISKSMKRQEMLQKEADHDALTGILNRKAAIRLIEASFEQDRDGVLFVMDIDDFKLLNDTWGHRAGDQVLTGFADILKKNSRTDDVCARLGGDEFLVYFPGLDREKTAAERAEMIRRQFRELNQENTGRYSFRSPSESLSEAVRRPLIRCTVQRIRRCIRRSVPEKVLFCSRIVRMQITRNLRWYVGRMPQISELKDNKKAGFRRKITPKPCFLFAFAYNDFSFITTSAHHNSDVHSFFASVEWNHVSFRRDAVHGHGATPFSTLFGFSTVILYVTPLYFLVTMKSPKPEGTHGSMQRPPSVG